MIKLVKDPSSDGTYDVPGTTLAVVKTERLRKGVWAYDIVAHGTVLMTCEGYAHARHFVTALVSAPVGPAIAVDVTSLRGVEYVFGSAVETCPLCGRRAVFVYDGTFIWTHIALRDANGGRYIQSGCQLEIAGNA